MLSFFSRFMGRAFMPLSVSNCLLWYCIHLAISFFNLQEVLLQVMYVCQKWLRWVVSRDYNIYMGAPI